MAKCTYYPEQVGQPYIPGHVEQVTDLAWNAGARSIIALSGDARVQFTMPKRNVGCYLGIAPADDDITNRNRITHGFYFFIDGTAKYRVVELGKALTTPASYTTATVFKIERVGGVVSLFAGPQLVRASKRASSGTIVVATVLYASGDKAPGND